MKLSVDEEYIINKFSQLILVEKDADSAIVALFRDLLYDNEIRYVNATNRLIITAFFQDVMDVINPYFGNQFSSFDIDLDSEQLTIQFYANPPEKNREDFISDVDYFRYLAELEMEVKREAVTIPLRHGER